MKGKLIIRGELWVCDHDHRNLNRAQRCARRYRKFLVKRGIAPEFLIEDVENWQTDVKPDSIADQPSTSVRAWTSGFERDRRKH